jgi:hypothetical protein
VLRSKTLVFHTQKPFNNNRMAGRNHTTQNGKLTVIGNDKHQESEFHQYCNCGKELYSGDYCSFFKSEFLKNGHSSCKLILVYGTFEYISIRVKIRSRFNRVCGSRWTQEQKKSEKRKNSLKIKQNFLNNYYFLAITSTVLLNLFTFYFFTFNQSFNK